MDVGAEDVVEILSEEECRIARNEIYARHGRGFNDKQLQDYFDACSWYGGTIGPEDFSEDIGDMSYPDESVDQVLIPFTFGGKTAENITDSFSAEVAYMEINGTAISADIKELFDMYENL